MASKSLVSCMSSPANVAGSFYMNNDIYQVLMEKLFPKAEINLDSSNPIHGIYLLLSGSEGPRWFVPENPVLGRMVLEHWRPYSKAAWVKWKILLYLYKFGLLGYMRGVKRIDTTEMGSILGAMEGCVPVVYIGTPSTARKLIVMLVRVSDAEIIGVVKIAVGERAVDAILNEANALTALSEKGVENLPRTISLDSITGTCRQTLVVGSPSRREFGRCHMDWLLSLPREGCTTLRECSNEYLERLKSSHRIPYHSRSCIFEHLTRNANDEMIPKVWVHGDFAPWNLKLTRDGKLVAVDWEDARIGLPMHDACHHFLMQAHLFSDRGVLEKLRRNKYVKQYLDEFSIDQTCLDGLIVCYMVDSILSDHEQGDGKYACYLKGLLEQW